MERLTLHDLATATGGTLSCPGERGRAFTGVSLDSRTVRPGEVFWAVEGKQVDGHEFVADAFARGAAAVVVRKPVDTDRPCVVVRDGVEALARLAGWYRSLLDAFVIGVTGSVGKTTTRELIFAALGGEPKAVRSRRNFNNEFGLPLTLLDIERRHRFAVVEMGAARVGDIAALCATARPEAGVITRLGVAHVETFGSEEAIVRGKGELAEAVPSEGFVVLPGDQVEGHQIARRAACECIFVGREAENTHRVSVKHCRPGALGVGVDGGTFEVAANGAHFAVAVGMAVAVARRLGRTDRQIAADLRAFEPVSGRGRLAVRSPWTVIDDSYNANPDSMRAAVASLANWPARGRRVLVCGDMWGLGARTESAHRDLGAYAAMSRIDVIVAVGSHAGQVAHGACREGMDARCLACFGDRESAAEWLRGSLRPGDAVWVKGSRPMELERLVEALAEAAEADGRAPVRMAA